MGPKRFNHNPSICWKATCKKTEYARVIFKRGLHFPEIKVSSGCKGGWQ